MKESKQMMAKEIAFMKKKGAPKSMVKHEEAEAGMKRGGKVKNFGKAAPGITSFSGGMKKYARGGGVEIKGKTRGKIC